MAIAIAAVIAMGLEVVIIGRPADEQMACQVISREFSPCPSSCPVVIGAIYELVRLIGEAGPHLNVILGRYRHPILEDRVMMFLDLDQLDFPGRGAG